MREFDNHFGRCLEERGGGTWEGESPGVLMYWSGPVTS